MKNSNELPQESQPKTFAELEKAPAVTSVELLATMKDYAEGGWAIAPRVVLALVDRVGLSVSEREIMRELAETGFKIQNDRQEDKAAQEYKEVADKLK